MSRISSVTTGAARAPDPVSAFLGVGWRFPLAIITDGTIATAAYEEDVAQAILILLGTNHGERVMRRTSGQGFAISCSPR